MTFEKWLREAYARDQISLEDLEAGLHAFVFGEMPPGKLLDAFAVACRSRLTDAPGQVIYYNPIQGRPEWAA